MRDASATGLPSGSTPGIVSPQTVRLTLKEAFRSAGGIGDCGKQATRFACIATLPLGVGVALRDQTIALHGRAVDAALAGEALADMTVDLPAELVARRHHPGVLAGFGGEREPARGDGARDIVRFHLGDIDPELLERLADLPLQAGHHGLFQRRIALVHDLVHDGGLHAGGLELGEGLAGVDGVELLRIAHQHYAGNTEFVRDPQQVARLDR